MLETHETYGVLILGVGSTKALLLSHAVHENLMTTLNSRFSFRGSLLFQSLTFLESFEAQIDGGGGGGGQSRRGAPSAF